LFNCSLSHWERARVRELALSPCPSPIWEKGENIK